MAKADEANRAAEAAHQAKLDQIAAEYAIDDAEQKLTAAEKAVKDADATVAYAEQKLNQVKTSGSAADKLAAQAALDSALAKQTAAKAAVEQAKINVANAEINAENAKVRADEAKDQADILAGEVTVARILADAAANAADAQAKVEEAQKVLAQAEEEKTNILNLANDLKTAETETQEAQEVRNSAYNNYLTGNTGIETATAGAEDTKQKSDYLDEKTNTLSVKKAKLAGLNTQMDGLLGTNSNDNATQKGQTAEALADAKVTAARDALSQAGNALNSANEALRYAEETIGEIPDDTTGVSILRAADAKSGDAAIRVTGNANIVSGGSLGLKQGYDLSMNVDGNITVQAAGNALIQSGQDVNLNKLTAGSLASVTNHGDITGVGTGTIISAHDVALDAVSTNNDKKKGDASTINHQGGSSMVISTESLGVRGDQGNISTVGNVTLEDVVTDSLELDARENIRQTSGTEVDAKSLKLTADGDIGRSNSPVRVSVDTLGASGNDLFIENRSGRLTLRNILGNNVSLRTMGDLYQVSGAVVKAHNLTIAAMGAIGSADNPLVVDVDGNLNIRSVYGRVFFINLYKVLTAQPDVPVAAAPLQMNFVYSDKGGALGYMSPNASFVVTELAMDTESATSDLLRQASLSASCVNALNVSIENGDGTRFGEKVFLMLEADGCETGTELYALHNRNGELELLKGYVWNGYAVFASKGLSQKEASGMVIVTEEGLGELGLDAGTAVSGGLVYSETGLGILDGEYLNRLVQILIETREAAEKEAA